MKTILALLVALLVSGCATDAKDASSQSSKSHLVVKRVQPGGPISVEGSVSFVRIEAEDGSVVAEEGFDAPDHGTDRGTYGYPSQLEFQLEPGTYTLVSYQRACDPSCDNLDPAGDHFTCQQSIEVEEGATINANVRVLRSDCEIEVSVVSP